MRLSQNPVNELYYFVEQCPEADSATVRIIVEHDLAAIRKKVEARIVAAVNASGDESHAWKGNRCPRCDSPSPELHPAMQHEGEVQECTHSWHVGSRASSE